MSFVRQQHEVRNVGGQAVPVYRPDIDSALYDKRIQDFCLKYFDEEKKRYVIPLEDNLALEFPKNYFLMFLYLILVNEKIVVRGRNLRPFIDRLKTLLPQKYLVDRSALSRLQSDWGGDTLIIVTGESLSDCSHARRKALEELHPDFVRMRRAWQKDAPPLTSE